MGTFPADAPQVVVETRCPPLRDYPSDVIKKSGKELRALQATDNTAATPGLIADYKLLRDQCRAYQAK